MAKFLSFIGYFFLCVFSLLLIVGIIRTTMGAEPITFGYILQSLQNCPNLVISPFSDLSIQGDWGLFDFLRSFLNGVATIIGYLLYFCSLILQAILFIGYALTTLLGVAPNVV